MAGARGGVAAGARGGAGLGAGEMDGEVGMHDGLRSVGDTTVILRSGGPSHIGRMERIRARDPLGAEGATP